MEEALPSTGSANRKAILLMAVGMTALAGNDAILRSLMASLPVGQLMFLRGTLLCVLLLAAGLIFRQDLRPSALLHRWCLLRGLGELAATYLFLTSLGMVPIATATTLVYVSPIILTALSGPLFGEKVGPWRWTAVVTGFIGVALVAAPGTAAWDQALLLPLGAACMVVLRDIATRHVDPSVSSTAVTLTTAIMVTLGGLASLAWGWGSPSLVEAGWTAGASALIAVSFFSLVVAIRSGELSLVAPVQYLNIVWAVIFGMLIWAEYPEPRAIVGGVLIIAAGILILYRESVQQQRLKRARQGAAA